MPARVLADVVVVVHLLWVLFLIFGGWWGRTYRPVMLVHVTGLAFAVISQLGGWYCPLTYLESWLRSLQEPAAAYPGSFIAHYAERFVYLEISPSAVFVLTIVLILVQAWLYCKAFRRQAAAGG